VLLVHPQSDTVTKRRVATTAEGNSLSRDVTGRRGKFIRGTGMWGKLSDLLRWEGDGA
jgi:hypothetical protein